MKKTIIFLLLSVSFVAKAQFSLQTEVQYLKLINAQGDKILLRNNLPDAEIVADSLILRPVEDKTLAWEFFEQLAYSYYLLGKTEAVANTLLRAKIFYSFELDQESIFAAFLGDEIFQYLLQCPADQQIEQYLDCLYSIPVHQGKFTKIADDFLQRTQFKSI